MQINIAVFIRVIVVIVYTYFYKLFNYLIFMNWYQRFQERRKKKREIGDQYISDLVYISGGSPEKGFHEKIGFACVLLMNAVIYDERTARREAESRGRIINSRLEEMKSEIIVP